MGETNWVLRDWEPQTLFRAGKNLYESDTHDFLLSFVSRKLRNRWHRVTEGKAGFLERKKKQLPFTYIRKVITPDIEGNWITQWWNVTYQARYGVGKETFSFPGCLFLKWLNMNRSRKKEYYFVVSFSRYDENEYSSTCSNNKIVLPSTIILREAQQWLFQCT